MDRARISILKAAEPTIAGHITFRVEDGGEAAVYYEFVVGPHGDRVSRGPWSENLHEVVGGRISIENYLPRGWSYADFMQAWCWWCRGHEAGYRAAEMEQARRAA